MILAATGHRPYKLGGYGVEVETNLYKLATAYLDLFLPKKPDKVISGMALGWDMAWAQAALDLDIPVIAAVAFKGVELRWPAESQKRFHEICERSTVIYVSERGYTPKVLQARNEWMVDHCDGVVALWNGYNSGTANCVRYADEVGKPVDNIWEYWLQIEKIAKAVDGNYI